MNPNLCLDKKSASCQADFKEPSDLAQELRSLNIKKGTSTTSLLLDLEIEFLKQKLIDQNTSFSWYFKYFTCRKTKKLKETYNGKITDMLKDKSNLRFLHLDKLVSEMRRIKTVTSTSHSYRFSESHTSTENFVTWGLKR